jgi:hypothetical protein
MHQHAKSVCQCVKCHAPIGCRSQWHEHDAVGKARTDAFRYLVGYGRLADSASANQRDNLRRIKCFDDVVNKASAAN